MHESSSNTFLMIFPSIESPRSHTPYFACAYCSVDSSYLTPPLPTVNLEWQEPSSHLHTQVNFLLMPMRVFPEQTERPSSKLGWKESTWRNRIAAKQCKWNSPCHFQLPIHNQFNQIYNWGVSHTIWHLLTQEQVFISPPLYCLLGTCSAMESVKLNA